MKGSVVITGGGTGGHLKVAKAFVDEIYKRGTKPFFIGSENGQDKEWFSRDIHIKKSIFLKSRGVVNKNFFGKIKALWEIFLEMQHCMDIFEKADVKTVISVGGFSAAPATFAAILTPGCKLYIHEQNSVMGRLNKLTARFATEVFSSYDENSKVKDYPVNIDFFDNGRIRSEVKTILFLGGSQGAVAINNFALKVAKYLTIQGIKIIHQTGKTDFERVKKEYEKLGIKADVFDFTTELVMKMSKADFAVSRAGASSLWELTANSLPTLFIPFPHAASNHQFHNAKFLKDEGLCFIAREDDLSQKTLIDALGKNINRMSKGLTESIMFGGVSKMVEHILYINDQQK